MVEERRHTEHGDRDGALGGEILRTVVGSGVHGIAIAGTDDHDEMGVFVEPPEAVIGVHRPVDHYVYRTQPEGAWSGPGDIDLVMYSLRKYLRLAAKGNPTVLLVLYAPNDSVLVCRPLGEQLRALVPALLARNAVHRFVGYMSARRDRLLGRGRRGRVPDRPKLVARYGYDVKYASHVLRLAYQGLEIVRDGRMSLPMPEHKRERVLRVKRGDAPVKAEVLDEIDTMQRSGRSKPGWPAAVRRCRPSLTGTRSRHGRSTPTGNTGVGRRPRYPRAWECIEPILVGTLQQRGVMTRLPSGRR